MPTIEEHLDKARRLIAVSPIDAIAELACAVTLAAKGGPSIANARQVLIDAFKEDPAWRQVYEDNIACVIMDFDKELSRPPGERPPLTHAQRHILADKILTHILA